MALSVKFIGMKFALPGWASGKQNDVFI